MDDVLNIYSINSIGTTTLGPGNRFVIWVQGCPFYCKGCMTPNSIPIVKNHFVSITEIVNMISDSETDGLTISGGEPFLQASKLSRLITEIKKVKPHFNVIVYSGYLRKELNWNGALKLLDQIDLLIDGRYIDKLNDDQSIRGSSNQQFHYLTKVFDSKKNNLESQKRHLEMKFNKNILEITGIPLKR